MKCISLWQPWASLMALGHKTIETRSWSTGYRGPLAIHAAKRLMIPDDPEFFDALRRLGITIHDINKLPLGAIVGACNLSACVPSDNFQTLLNVAAKGLSPEARARAIESIERQKIFGDYSPGRFLWLVSNIKKLETPIPCRGRQGLFEVEIPL